MATQPRSRPLTYADYCDLPDDGKRYELIAGEVYVAPSPTFGHQSSSFRLARTLADHVDERELGTVMIAPFDVVLSDVTTVQPDILFVSRQREHIIEPRGIFGAPDLVVEVLSPSNASLDLGAKRDEYAGAGVPNYWSVNPMQRTMRAFALDRGVYREVQSAQGEETFRAPPFPDLVILLRDLWT
jgi:Uma2 family endonuclease